MSDTQQQTANTLLTGFKQTGWWDRHRILNRHHLMLLASSGTETP